jgi:ATP-dependent Clp protease ATP-binding subunit ClpA
VKLTDQFVKDRMRPDKAIDAIDEACAHLQATVEYTPRTEELIKQRVELLKEAARSERDRERGRERDREEKRKADQRADQPQEPSAFERFGAELEALFVGAPEPVEPAPVEPAKPAANGKPPKPVTLAPLETDLAQRLMEEGVVIRGHDIARVVGLMSGSEVLWEEASPQ